jgi:hypothetical protein
MLTLARTAAEFACTIMPRPYNRVSSSSKGISLMTRSMRPSEQDMRDVSLQTMRIHSVCRQFEAAWQRGELAGVGAETPKFATTQSERRLRPGAASSR